MATTTREFVDMPVLPNDVEGIAATIKALRKLDAEYKKQFMAEVSEAVEPAAADARSRYPQMPLSGMARSWTPKARGGYSAAGRKAFPWDVAKVRKGIKVKADTRRNARAVVYVTQSNPAGRQFELAKSDYGRLGPAIRSRHPRVIWPAIDRHMPDINAGVRKAVDNAVAKVNEEVR